MGLPIFGPKLPKHGTFCPNSTQFYVLQLASCLETLGKQFAEIAELTLLVMSLPFLPSFKQQGRWTITFRTHNWLHAYPGLNTNAVYVNFILIHGFVLDYSQSLFYFMPEENLQAKQARLYMYTRRKAIATEVSSTRKWERLAGLVSICSFFIKEIPRRPLGKFLDAILQSEPAHCWISCFKLVQTSCFPTIKFWFRWKLCRK